MLHQINTYQELDIFLKKTGWQSFEELVADVFNKHGYTTTIRKKYFDVIALKNDKKIYVECKKHKKHNNSQLISFVKHHEKKVEKKGETLLITLNSSPQIIKNTLIIPFHLLNEYLLNN